MYICFQIEKDEFMTKLNTKQKNNRKRQINKSVFRKASVIILLVIVSCFLINKLLAKDQNLNGRNYLKTMEKKDVHELDDNLEDRKQTEMTNMIETGQINLAAMLADTLILGDSRGCGFTDSGLISSSLNRSIMGANITQIQYQLDLIEQVQPKNIVLVFGANDIALYLDEEYGCTYGEIYEKEVAKIHEVSPNSKIIVCKMPPANSVEYARRAFWAQTDEFNQDIEETCKRNGWGFVDTDRLHITDADYKSDGFHFNNELYPSWAALIVEQLN